MYSRTIKNKKLKNKKSYLVTATVILIIVGVIVAVVWAEKSNRINLVNNGSNTEKPSPAQQETINFSPPTVEEKSTGDEIKQENNTLDTTNTQGASSLGQDSETNANPEPQNDQKNVSLIITDTGVYDSLVEVSAFIPDIVANGTCTYTFKSGSTTIAKETLARADASSTICIDKPFPVDELSSSNTWSVSVTYQSDSKIYNGSKEAMLKI